jgi:hypothetical protein
MTNGTLRTAGPARLPDRDDGADCLGEGRHRPAVIMCMATLLSGQSSYHKQAVANYDNSPHLSAFKATM